MGRANIMACAIFAWRRFALEGDKASCKSLGLELPFVRRSTELLAIDFLLPLPLLLTSPYHARPQQARCSRRAGRIGCHGLSGSCEDVHSHDAHWCQRVPVQDVSPLDQVRGMYSRLLNKFDSHRAMAHPMCPSTVRFSLIVLRARTSVATAPSLPQPAKRPSII